MSDALRKVAEKHGEIPQPLSEDDINAALEQAAQEAALPPEADFLKDRRPKERKAQGQLDLRPPQA